MSESEGKFKYIVLVFLFDQFYNENESASVKSMCFRQRDVYLLNVIIFLKFN